MSECAVDMYFFKSFPGEFVKDLIIFYYISHFLIINYYLPNLKFLVHF